MLPKIIGADHIPATGSAIVVANHVSQGDGEILQQATKRKIRRVDSSYRLGADELVVFFPERTPSQIGTIGTFEREVEDLIALNPGIAVIPACIASLPPHPTVLAVGRAVEGPQTAASLRQHVVELSCKAIEHSKTSKATLVHRLVRNARHRWRAAAIADSSRKSLSYGETLTGGILFRNWLRGAHPSEQHIGVLLPSSVGAALVNYGITLAGKTAVNLNFTAGEQNCRAAIAQCEIRTVVTSRAFLEKASLSQWPEMVFLEDLLVQFTRVEKLHAYLTARFAPEHRLGERIHPDAIACILFSSGSTGTPKGVALTHWNVLANADGCASLIPVNEDDCILGVLPFFHSFGYTFALWFPLLEGFRAVYHGSPTDAKVIGELTERHQATFFLSTPTFCLQYARKCEKQQFRTLKYILVGAEKLRDSVLEEFRRHFGIELLAGYGCTELGPGVAINRPDIVDGNRIQHGTRPGSVGRPLPGIAIRIVDPDNFAPLPPRQQGMVLVKGPSRMPGYYRDPQKTAEVMHDGYYVTGDLGYVDEDGFLYISDRVARFSKIAGEMVPHLRIEEAIADLTASFVTGVPDERRGERLVMMYTNPGIESSELLTRLNNTGLPPLWIPKRENIYLVTAIPALASGKVDLKKARELAGSLITPKVRSSSV